MSGRRRNGLLSSCEPCRKSKLRCDHATPCGRCRRRKNPDQCVYHPAPMTKRASPDRASSEAVDGSLLSRARDTLPSPDESWTTGNTNNTLQNQVAADHLSPDASLRAKFIAELSKKTTSPHATGVLGPTSYSAVYDESEDVIKSSPMVAASFGDSSKSLRKNLAIVDSRQIQLGAELLLFLFEDFTLYERMSISRYCHCEGYVFAPPLLQLLFASVRHMLNSAIEDRSNPMPDLLRLSQRIFENCLKPVYVDAHMTAQDYFISMPNRWEIIAVIFSVIGSSSYLLPASDFIALDPKGANFDRNGLALVSIAAADKCIKFCDNAGVMSEPLSWALLAHVSLLTHVYGDHDYRPWKTLGDLCTLIFALGYHQKANSLDLPFFLTEHRKRLLLGAYTIDKELATFLGRPPRISWRHIDVDLPLDISYEELLSGPDIRDAAISRLDHNGWNAQGIISRTSFARSIYVMGPVRELILELSLNTRIDDVEGKVEEIQEVARNTRSKLPLRLQKPNWLDCETMEEFEANILSLWMHMECLYNEFNMQRILVKRAGHKSDTLREIAHEMLRSCLLLTGNRAPDGRDNNNVAWNVSYYGLPSAGVLAIELLRQCQNADSDPTFPRSEIIQNLSRFAADLEYAIPRDAGNYEICQQGRKAIRSILDRVLSTPVVPLVPSSTETSSGPVDWLTSDEFWLSQDSEFMKWINNFDWNQELPE